MTVRLLVTLGDGVPVVEGAPERLPVPVDEGVLVCVAVTVRLPVTLGDGVPVVEGAPERLLVEAGD